MQDKLRAIEARFEAITEEMGQPEVVADYLKHYEPPTRIKLVHVATTFLMSTDFFPNGARESRPLRYVMLYHPYRTPCYNPLARVEFD